VSVQSISAIDPRGKQSKVWRGLSRSCELGLRLSGVCWTKVQEDKADEGWKELQGPGVSRGQRHVRSGLWRSQTGLQSVGVRSDGIDNAGDVLGWL
jgi:hypothetical protein